LSSRPYPFQIRLFITIHFGHAIELMKKKFAFFVSLTQNTILP